MRPDISFIVPVYNRETLLDRCVHSVVDSGWNNFEIILVNNASTDNSGALCEQWAKKDSRIRVITLAVNQGAAGGRNAGLDAVPQGEWIFFLDSDDTVCTANLPIVLKKLEALPRDTDAVAINVMDILPTGIHRTPLFYKDELLETSDFLKRYPRLLCVPLWNYLFRRRLLEKEHFRFSLYRYNDDALFVAQTIPAAEYIAIFTDYFYCYNSCAPDSLNAAGQRGTIEDYLEFIALLCHQIEKFSKRNPDIKTAYEYNLLLLAQNVILLYYDTVPKNRQFMGSYREICRQYGPKMLAEQLFREWYAKCLDIPHYIAPAGRVARKFAEWIIQDGGKVLGALDSNASKPFVKGTSIPLLPLDRIHQVSPVVIVNASVIGAKLEALLNQGLEGTDE